MELGQLFGWGADGWGDEWARGTLTTVLVALAAFALALVFGTLGAFAKLSRLAPLRLLGELYTTLMRGIPELLVIYLVFFGGGLALTWLAERLIAHDGYVDIPVFAVGALCLGVIGGAYATEAIRAAILAVPKGQIEAAAAVGMGPRDRLRRILLPQAARHAIPGLSNVWINTLKDTSLLAIVGLVEITRTAQLGAGSLRTPFTFYFVAFLLFLAVASLSRLVLARAEAWAERGVPAERVGEAGRGS